MRRAGAATVTAQQPTNYVYASALEIQIDRGSLRDISLPLSSPAWVFLILFLIALVMPIAAERLRLPGVIGLIVGGLLVGPEVFGLLELRGLVSQLGGFGILYLMFLAGLELDLDVLERGKQQAAVFGLLTFLIPLAAGVATSLALGFGMAAAILIGSFWSSHTLVAYPTIRRFGLARDPAVTATLGATIVTDTMALLVLAVVVALNESRVAAPLVALRLSVGLLVLAFIAFVVLPRLTLWFFKGLGQDGLLRFLYVIASLLALSVIADLAGTEPIIGAFFAGLALNRLVPNTGFLMRRIEFVGSSILIPVFLISVGMLVDLSVVTDPRTLTLAASFTAVVIGAKYAAAWLTGKAYGFDRDRVHVMFSLSVAQAAATLAAAIVGFEAGIIDETTVNAALIVILVTVVLASWAAGKSAQAVTPAPTESKVKLGSTVLVPIANLESAPNLLSLALVVARSDAGSVIPLHVVTTPGPEAMHDARQLQNSADRLISEQGAETSSVLRVDASVAQGISHAAVESGTSLVIVGWTETSSTRRAVLGSVIDDLVSSVPAPLAIAHLPHFTVGRILLHEVRGASSVETNAAVDLAIRLGRSQGLRVAAQWIDQPPIAAAEITYADSINDGDLMVIAAPGGADFTRTVNDLILANPHIALVAIRAYAGTPDGLNLMTQVFGD